MNDLTKATTIKVDCEPRYWEDASVNGIEDTEGTLVPCRHENAWQPIIDISTGRITNWTKGVSAKIHYKVCDAGAYTLLDASGTILASREGYVPDFMSPKKNGWGDYIILTISEDGMIENWSFTLSYFQD